jgi:hypothetical protein
MAGAAAVFAGSSDSRRSCRFFDMIEYISFRGPHKVPESVSKQNDNGPISIVCGAASAAWMALWGYFVVPGRKQKAYFRPRLHAGEASCKKN